MLNMALRTFRRDWKAGEVKVLLFALTIAVMAMVAIGSITDRVHRAMGEQSSEFLGADYTFESPRPIDDAWIERGRNDGLEITRSQSFATVLSSDDNFQLVSVRALDGKFPLKGTIEIAEKPFTQGVVQQAQPKAGTIWLEPRILGVLGVEVGDTIDFGSIQLTVDGVIVAAPGQASEVFNVAPKVLIHIDDVEKANIVQEGSRLEHILFIAGEPAAREPYIQWLKSQKNPTQEITGGKEGTPALKAALERAETFLRLASLISVVLAGVAIAVAAGRYSQRHFDYSAIYRCLGMQIRQVHKLYLWQLLMIGLIGSGLGLALGLGLQSLIINQFSDYLPKPMVGISLAPVITGSLSGLVVLLGFALPSFLQIAKVPPLRVLRKELLPRAMSSWVIYLLSIGVMALLMWWQSNSLLLVGILLAVAVVTYLLIRLIAWFIFKIGVWLGKRGSLPVRFGVGQLKQYPAFTISQISAFGLAFIIMLSTVLLRSELLSEWQSQLPEGAPNHFLVNVQEQEVEPLESILQESGVSTKGIYPMVRGRVVGLNDMTLEEALDENQQRVGAVRRELNLTWMADVPEANKVTQGEWWSESDVADDRAELSVGEELAQRLGLEIGDVLKFSIGGLEVEGEITNLRSIQWDSFQPNFFIIFEPGGLDGFPASYITSFHLPVEDKGVLNQILREMPTVTIIELDAIMEQVQSILDQVTMAVEFIMLFVLLAGIAVLYAVLQVSREERLLSATLLKALGARKKFIRASILAELILLGAFSGVLGVIGGEVLVNILYSQAFDIDLVLHPWYWLWVPMISVGFIGIVGWLGLRHLLNQPAHQVLREY
ncbi:ABC transporter permease [Kangiella taiwanensis]|uniref:ABC transporter permease n=2 Tax=Kangiella taiwanensis TaxID=1079179 RepID=A0ABP8HQY6_9GAMM